MEAALGIVDNGALIARPGDGAFIHRDTIDLTGLRDLVEAEMDPAGNFGARIAP